MKKVLLFALLQVIFCGNILAGKDVKVAGVTLGTDYLHTLDTLKAQFGVPLHVTTRRVTFKDHDYMNMHFDNLVFGFARDAEGNRYFNEASFEMISKTKAEALKKMEQIAKQLTAAGEKLSWDMEWDGKPFYKGGASPVKPAYLYTVYMYFRDGQYKSLLRYGPIYFKATDKPADEN